MIFIQHLLLPQRSRHIDIIIFLSTEALLLMETHRYLKGAVLPFVTNERDVST